MTIWHLYLIWTATGELYTGIITDVERRFAEHGSESGKGAKYLRGKGPLTLEFSQQIGNRSAATKVELAVKKMPKADKEKLIRGLLAVE